MCRSAMVSLLTIQTCLANDQGAGVLLHRQPVSRLLLGAQDDLEAPVRRDIQRRRLEVARRRHAATLPIVPLLREEPQVVNGPAGAPDAVLVFSANRRVLIVVVGMIGAHLRGFVHHALEHGRERVIVLDERLQSRARDPAQVPETLHSVHRIAGCVGPEHDVARHLERVAKLVPHRSVDNLSFCFAQLIAHLIPSEHIMFV